MLKRLALLLLLLLTPAIAWAGNAVTSITLQSRANTQSIAVSSSLGGDDDTSAVCKIYYGAVSTVCDTGMTM